MSAISAFQTITVSAPAKGGARGRAVRRAVRCEAGSAPVVNTGRRGAALGGAAVIFAGMFGGARDAKAVECNMVTPCMPGTEPGAPPRYIMPGPAYSPAEAAEERFRAKIQAERAAEKTAYEKAAEAREEAAAARAAAKAAAEAEAAADAAAAAAAAAQ